MISYFMGWRASNWISADSKACARKIYG